MYECCQITWDHKNKNVPVLCFPSVQYDYMERLDGKEKWSVVESPRERRSIQTVVLNEAVFVQYLDPGTWHLAFYNDGKEKESVSFSTAVLGQLLTHGLNSTLYICFLKTCTIPLNWDALIENGKIQYI